MDRDKLLKRKAKKLGVALVEIMTDEELMEKQRVLQAEIDALEGELSSVSTEIFHRSNRVGLNKK